MEVQVRPFTRTEDGVFDKRVAILVSDDKQKAEAYRAAGCTLLADQHEYLVGLAPVRADYAELTDKEYAMYCAYFSQLKDSAEHNEQIPPDALGYVIKARSYKGINKVTFHTHPRTGETVAIATAYHQRFGSRRFLIVQWGNELTGRSTLQRWHLVYRLTHVRLPMPLQFVVAFAVAFAVACLSHLLTGGSWPFVGAMAFWTIVAWLHWSRDRYGAIAFMTAIVLSGMSVASLFIGFAEWNTADRTVVAAVCDIEHTDSSYYYTNSEYIPPQIVTTAGVFSLEAGNYLGTSFAGDSMSQAAKLLKGNQVRLTVHGHLGVFWSKGTAPYVTKAEYLGTGNCGAPV